jgi:hypothetical protein
VIPITAVSKTLERRCYQFFRPHTTVKKHFLYSFLGSTAQLKPWPPAQNPAEFVGGFSTIFFFTG